MRTVLFIGLLCIADSIKESHWSDNTIHFMSAIFIASMVMDLTEWIKNVFKN